MRADPMWNQCISPMQHGSFIPMVPIRVIGADRHSLKKTLRIRVLWFVLSMRSPLVDA